MLIVHEIAETVLENLARTDQKMFLRVSDALDDLQEHGLRSRHIKKLTTNKKIFRKRVGRWRLLFTVDQRIIHVWIIALKRSNEKDYRKWISFISSRV